MENVILVILLILALCLICVVLIQRSEGGGLGMGGGGGAVSGRSAATALGRVTWVLGAAFMAMCILMTVLGARNSVDTSVIDRLGADAPAVEEGAPGLPLGDLLPPSSDEPLTPRAD